MSKETINRTYVFSLATNRNGSETKEDIELKFDKDFTEDQIERLVQEEYIDWVMEQNQGGYWLK